jgi:hypothetical protein
LKKKTNCFSQFQTFAENSDTNPYIYIEILREIERKDATLSGAYLIIKLMKIINLLFVTFGVKFCPTAC